MSTTIESLELEVKSNGSSAVSGIDALSASLTRLKTATKGGMGLASVTNQLGKLNTALNGVDASATGKLDALANSLQKLHSLGNLKISSSIASQITSIGTAVRSLGGVDFGALNRFTNAIQPLANIGSLNLNSTISQLTRLPTAISALSSVNMASVAQQIRSLVNALIPLTAIGNANLGSFFTQIGRLPQMMATLNSINMQQLTTQIRQLAAALAPLANQMNAIARGFAAFPARIQQLIRSNGNLRRSNNQVANSYVNLWARCRMAMNVVRGGTRLIASWIHESNRYIEDLNLFTASLGEYAAEAKEYAQTVAEVMGIDPADWLRNQGVFNTIVKGFGVASDKALIMSKNLTQLGYDISSFHNISVEDAMTKLTSGISGELEPLRRLGYDLSVARLQEEALALGIKKKVSAMTQAEKSQLRYYAIMTQVTTAQGDMARTLDAPANQLRILQAQVTQCARALGNIFIPVLNAVLPYCIAFVKVLRMIADGIANLVGFQLQEVDSSGLDTTVGLGEDLGDAFEEANEEAKKFKRTVMGFDELNLLRGDDDSSLKDALEGLGDGFNIDLPEYDFLGTAIELRVDKIVNILKNALWEITAIISGFQLAIGTILVVTGANIPVGLGLMAVGAVGLAAAVIANWNTMSDQLARTLTVITAVLGGFLLAIGTILVVTGANVPLGAGLMVAGAVSLATAATINWKFLEGDLKNTLSILTGIVAGALLAMGALFAFTGATVPLGIALMVAGAVGLATAIGLNWNAMTEPMRLVIGTLEAIVGSALLTFGAILALTGANIPLGVAMIAAGAVSLVAAIALNWGALTGDVQTQIQTITLIVSGALLGVGAILALSGVNMPLGIALIAAGAVGIIAAAPLDWGAIIKAIGNVLKEIGIALGAALLVLGAVLAFTGVALPLGVALMAAGAVSLVTGVALNWNAIVSKVKEVLKSIGIAAGAAMLALGIILAITGVALPIGIALIAAGAASLTAGVALNLDTVVEKVSSFFKTIGRLLVGVALVALGVLLVGTGVGLPLGIALIKMGVSALTKPESFNVQNLINIGKQAIEGIAKGVQTAWNSFISFWKGLFEGAVNWVKGFLGIYSPSTVFQNIGINMTAGLQNGLSNIGSVFTNVFQTVGNWIGNFGSNMFSWGSEMMGNLVTGINSGLSSLAPKVASAANTIRSYLHFSQPDIGPLSDFNSWMPDMMSQLASGIEDNEDKVQKAVARLAGDMSLESSISANVSSSGAAASAVADDNSGLVSAVYDAVTSALAASNGDDGGTPIIINLGNEQIASFLVKQNKRIALISGGRA